MSDIFISYARTTEREAMAIAEALRGLGYGVWRDDELPAHRAYADVIAERLAAAKAVVVVWSAEAVRSAWVQSEADRARNDGKLVQLSLDGAILPMPFDRIQCADLASWSGQADHPGWAKVADSVAALVGGGVAAPAKAAASPRQQSICVLPFANMSGDPEQEYFSDGISEDIITDLSKVSALFVIARNTAFTFKGKSLEIPEIARKLGVRHVLEGSVRKAGNRVRITAQLIDGETGGHAWAERWDRTLDDIFALQDEITQAIVAALKIKLLPAEKKEIEKRGTESPEAYELYLQARRLRAGGNTEARIEEAAVSLCQRAIAIDPNYAMAWVLMAAAQMDLAYRYGRTGEDGTAAIERALALDPNLGAAHAMLARALHRADRRDEAYAELDLALRLDPDNFDVNVRAGTMYYNDRRLTEAVRHYEMALAAMAGSEYDVGAPLMSAQTALGDRGGALRTARIVLESAEQMLAQDSSNGAALAGGMYALAVLGERDRARQWTERALLIDPDNQHMRYNLACVLSLHLNDAEGALSLLEPIFATSRDRQLMALALTDPDFDPIRGDPRFRDLLDRAKAKT